MQTSTVNKAVLLILVAGISVTFLSMIQPFLMAVLLAGIFSSLAQPVFKRFTRWFGGRRSPASIVTLFMIVLLIIIPLALLLGVVTAEAIKVGESVSPWVQDKLNNPDEVALWLKSQPLYSKIEPYEGEILTRAGQMVNGISKFLINNLSFGHCRNGAFPVRADDHALQHVFFSHRWEPAHRPHPLLPTP